jgi:hypothetical protein
MTVDEEAAFIELWNQGLELTAIAQRLGIPKGTVESRAHRLKPRGLIQPRPKGGAYPRRKALARQEGTPAPVHSGAEPMVMHGAQTVQNSAVHAHLHGAVQVQNRTEPPVPAALAVELGRLWAAIDALRQDMHRPMQDTVQSLPEPLFDDPADNTTERWSLYLKRGLRAHRGVSAGARHRPEPRRAGDTLASADRPSNINALEEMLMSHTLVAIIIAIIAAIIAQRKWGAKGLLWVWISSAAIVTGAILFWIFYQAGFPLLSTRQELFALAIISALLFMGITSVSGMLT